MQIKKPLTPEYKKEVLRDLKKGLDLRYEFNNIAGGKLTNLCRKLEKHVHGKVSNIVVEEKIIVVSDPDGSQCEICHDPIFSTIYTEMSMYEETGEIDYDSSKRRMCESCVTGSIYDGLPKVYF